MDFRSKRGVRRGTMAPGPLVWDLGDSGIVPEMENPGGGGGGGAVLVILRLVFLCSFLGFFSRKSIFF